MTTIDDETKDANTVKSLVLKQLLKDGHINQAIYDEYLVYWNVIILKRGWFKFWFEKIGKADNYFYKYIKL